MKPLTASFTSLCQDNHLLSQFHPADTDQSTNSTLFAHQICYTFLSDPLASMIESRNVLREYWFSVSQFSLNHLENLLRALEVQISEEKFPGKKIVF